MKEVRAELKGTAGDLSTLRRLFGNLSYRVSEYKGKTVLTCPDFDACRDTNDARALAEQIIKRINAAVRFRNLTFSGAALDELSFIDADGIPKRTVTCDVTFSFNIDAEEKVQDGISFSERLADLQRRSVAVENAMMLIVFAPLTWGSLYSIYEIVREDLDRNPKNWRKLATLGLAEPDIARFRATASSSAATGLLSRHGRADRSPVENPMKVHEAEHFIRRMVGAWVRGKLKQHLTTGSVAGE